MDDDRGPDAAVLFFDHLPAELTTLVLTNVPIGWRFCARAVCRLWHDVLDADAERNVTDDRDKDAYLFLGIPHALIKQSPHKGPTLSCCRDRALRPDEVARIRDWRRGAIVRASTVAEWIRTAPDGWEWVPHEMVAWLTRACGAPLADLALVLSGSGHGSLVERALAHAPGWADDLLLKGIHRRAARDALLTEIAKRTNTDIGSLEEAMADVPFERETEAQCLDWAIENDHADAAACLVLAYLSKNFILVNGYNWWKAIGIAGARRVLSRLTDVMGDGVVDAEIRTRLVGSWTHYGRMRCLAGAIRSENVLLVEALLFTAGSTTRPKDIARLACLYGSTTVVRWAMEAATARGLQPLDPTRIAIDSVEANMRRGRKNTWMPEDVIRWLCDPQGGAYTPTRVELMTLVANATAPTGDAGCAVYLLERRPSEIVSLGVDQVTAVVFRACSDDSRKVCDDCQSNHHNGGFVGSTLERLVWALDGCREFIVAKTNADVECHAAVDLWNALFDALTGPRKGVCYDGFQLHTSIRYAFSRYMDVSDPGCVAQSRTKRAPTASWRRWCNPCPIPRLLLADQAHSDLLAWLDDRGMILPTTTLSA